MVSPEGTGVHKGDPGVRGRGQGTPPFRGGVPLFPSPHRKTYLVHPWAVALWKQLAGRMFGGGG